MIHVGPLQLRIFCDSVTSHMMSNIGFLALHRHCNYDNSALCARTGCKAKVHTQL